jgi:hypothetical protein
MQTYEYGQQKKLQNLRSSSLNFAATSSIVSSNIHPVQPALKVSENTCVTCTVQLLGYGLHF